MPEEELIKKAIREKGYNIKSFSLFIEFLISRLLAFKQVEILKESIIHFLHNRERKGIGTTISKLPIGASFNCGTFKIIQNIGLLFLLKTKKIENEISRFLDYICG